MRYLPAIFIAIGVAGATIYGLYITRNPYCLWALSLMYFAYMATPFQENER